MKKTITTFILVLAVAFAHSQSPLPKGSKQVNFGLGFSSHGIPIYGGMDFAVHDNVSVGFDLSYRGYNNNEYKHSIFGIAGRVDYHWNKLLNIPANWDFYAGANIGFSIWSEPDDNYHGDDYSGLGLGIQVGGRYYFNDNWGINLELGGGNRMSGGRIGMSYKF